MSDRNKPRKLQFPVIEELNLRVTAQDVPLTKPFRFVKRIIFHIEFATNTLVFTAFGKETALAKGLQIKYANELLLPHGLQRNGDFSGVSYDTRIDTDATGTKINFLNSRFSFWKFTRNGEGLRITPDKQLSVVVQDDLSSSNTLIEAYVQGWRYI